MRLRESAPQPVKLDWQLPTKNTDGSTIQASGADALSKVEVFLSTATIDAANPGAPFATLTASSVTTSQNFSAPYGSVVFARIRVQNNSGVYSDLTNELQIQTAHKPGVPTNFTFTLLPGGTLAVETH